MDKKILILEDDVIVAESVKILLDENGYIGKVALEIQEALDLLKEHNFLAVISDINLNDGMDGIDFVEKYIQNAAPVIFLTAYSDDETLAKVENSQSYAYITKPFKKEQLLTNLKLSIANFKKNLKVYNLKEKTNIDVNVSLSKREVEILKLVIKGKTSEEIGDILFISPLTVSTHRRNILKKTKAKSNIELLSLATQKGWV